MQVQEQEAARLTLDTPTSLLRVSQLLCFMILTAFVISTLNLGIGIKLKLSQDIEIKAVRKSYDRINLTATNRLILRCMLNMAANYEP